MMTARFTSKSACATSAVKHAIQPRPVVGAQLTAGCDWLPEIITDAPNGRQAGPLAPCPTNPASISWNHESVTNGDAGKCDKRCGLFSASLLVFRLIRATIAPCNAGGARYSRSFGIPSSLQIRGARANGSGQSGNVLELWEIMGSEYSKADYVHLPVHLPCRFHSRRAAPIGEQYEG